MNTPSHHINELYLTACNELFSAYGLDLRLEDKAGTAPAESFVSVLGANGEQVQLLSTLNIDTLLLSRLHPAGPAQIQQSCLEDWCRELNNQLVGRLKNKLLRLGCEVMIGLPTLLTGHAIKTVSSPKLEARDFCFSSEHGSMMATLSLQLDPELVFSTETPEEVKVEGALFLF